jgi:hypothetical protein
MNEENNIRTTTDAEIEDLRRENEELKTAVRFRDALERMTAELNKAGARSPHLLFDLIKTEIEFDEEGKPANLGHLVERLRAKFPEQFGKDMPAPSIDAGAGAAKPANLLTAEALAAMSPAEIGRLDWAEVRRVLAG